MAGEKETVISLYEEEMQPTVCERYIVSHSGRSGLSLPSCVCRFVHEQQVQLQSGVGEEEAARKAFWAVRKSGVDIQLNEVCTVYVVA